MRYPRVIAHRGGGALAPENTLAGLRIAHRLGCRGVEFDVALTADAIPVLVHDDTLDRCTDGSGPVAAHTLAQLRRLDAGVRHGGAFCGERIPTLDEALVCCRELGLWANIEIKPTPGQEREMSTVVMRALEDAWDGNGIVSSFSEDVLGIVANLAPDVPRAWLSESLPDDWRQRLARLGARSLHLDAEAGAAAVAAVAGSGVPVACYTVNRRDAAEGLFAAGAVAIFSDRPDLWKIEDYGG